MSGSATNTKRQKMDGSSSGRTRIEIVTNDLLAQMNMVMSRHQRNSTVQTIVPIPDLDTFTVDEYLGRYRGMARIERAKFLGKVCPELAKESYQIALNEVMDTTTNIGLYKSLVGMMRDLEMEVNENKEWIKKANEENSSEIDYINSEIGKATRNRYNKGAREAYEKLSKQYIKMGEYDKAVKALVNMKELSVKRNDTHAPNIASARINAALCKWGQVRVFTQAAYSNAAPSTIAPAEVIMKMNFLHVQALFGEYKCNEIADIIQAQGLAYDECDDEDVKYTVSPVDIAIYGTLATLSCMGRENVQANLLESTEFRKFLDDFPVCLEMVQHFCSSRYEQAIDLLLKIESFAKIDMVMAPHISLLVENIRENISVLYIKPFASISISRMAKTLRMSSQNTLEKQLAMLIEKGKISARIDDQTGFLIKYVRNDRDIALDTIESIYSTFDRNTELMLRHIRLLREETGLVHIPQ